MEDLFFGQIWHINTLDCVTPLAHVPTSVLAVSTQQMRVYNTCVFNHICQAFAVSTQQTRVCNTLLKPHHYNVPAVSTQQIRVCNTRNQSAW